MTDCDVTGMFRDQPSPGGCASYAQRPAREDPARCGGGSIIISSTKAVRTAIAAASAAGLVALAATSASAAGSAAPARPALSLVSPVTDVTLTAEEDYGTDLNLSTYLVAGNAPIEVRATRANFNSPVVAKQYVKGKATALPKGLVTDFS